MIVHHDLNNQLPNEIKPTFQELRLLHHLRKAGITKRFCHFMDKYIIRRLPFCVELKPVGVLSVTPSPLSTVTNI